MSWQPRVVLLPLQDTLGFDTLWTVPPSSKGEIFLLSHVTNLTRAKTMPQFHQDGPFSSFIKFSTNVHMNFMGILCSLHLMMCNEMQSLFGCTSLGFFGGGATGFCVEIWLQLQWKRMPKRHAWLAS